MPNFTLVRNPTPSQIGQITELYRMAGWWTKESGDPDLVSAIVSGSRYFMIAETDSEIVAMGRVISDGASDAYIQDLAVKNGWRGKGIGAGIVERLVARLRGEGICWIGLVAEKGSLEFYTRLGFKKMADSEPMIFTNGGMDEF